MSITIPFPTTCPARDVPAALGIKLILFSDANDMTFFMSSIVDGMHTAAGVSL